VDAKSLEAIPLFRDLSKKDREQIARWADEVDVPAGFHLLEQGAFPHEFFVVEEGTVAVTKDGARLTDLGPGDFFGEIAILEHDRRTATVVAATQATLIVMLARDFETMAEQLPDIADQVHAAIRERMSR